MEEKKIDFQDNLSHVVADSSLESGSHSYLL